MTRNSQERALSDLSTRFLYWTIAQFEKDPRWPRLGQNSDCIVFAGKKLQQLTLARVLDGNPFQVFFIGAEANECERLLDHMIIQRELEKDGTVIPTYAFAASEEGINLAAVLNEDTPRSLTLLDGNHHELRCEAAHFGAIVDASTLTGS